MKPTETLHELLTRACPPHRRESLDKNGSWRFVPDEKGDHKSVALLAKMLGMSAWGVQKWCKSNRVPPRRAAQIVDLNPSEVSLADFSRFIYL